MAKSCVVTGKSSQVGGQYSNRVRATKFNPCGSRRRYANLQKKTLFIPETGKSVTITVSARGLRTIAKRGAYAVLRERGVIA